MTVLHSLKSLRTRLRVYKGPETRHCYVQAELSGVDDDLRFRVTRAIWLQITSLQHMEETHYKDNRFQEQYALLILELSLLVRKTTRRGVTKRNTCTPKQQDQRIKGQE